MTKITAPNALELAKLFRESSSVVGTYLYDEWNSLNSKDREKLRSIEVTLLNVSTDLVTQAVGIVIDEGQASLSDLAKVTKKATAALKKIDGVKKAIKIATALIGLAAAIPTGNVKAIVGAFEGVKESIDSKDDEQDDKAKSAKKSAGKKAIAAATE